MKPAVFLDRDNTLIHNDGDLGDPALVRLIQGAGSAIASLCGLGYKIVVITNQGGVARGKYTEDDVRQVHDRLHELVVQAANGARIDAFYYCPYHPDGSVHRYKQEHPTRKPQPGMLLQAAEQMQLDLSQSWTIGDQLRDIEAGRAAGTRTILLNPAGQLPAADLPDAQRPDFVARSLIEAVRIVAQKRHPESVEEAERRSVGAAASRRWDAAAVAKLQQASKPEPGEPGREEDGGEGDEPAAPREPKAGPSKPARREARRGFRPWDARGHDEADADAGSSEASPLFEVEAEAKSTAVAEPAAPPAVRQPGSHREPESPAVAAVDHDRAGDAGASKVPAETTLRQILHELRHQRDASHGFSYATVLAIVLQMVAGVCLLGGLWMGAGDTDLFFRWIGAGIIVQGATIATLLFPR
ncbi:MAG: HAD-IIIA family hydrolase [Phycisphaeraceae bacterium]